MNRRLVKSAALVLVGSMSLLAADYAKEMKKAIKRSLGGDFGRYQILGTPISNFGVGTMYPKAAQRETFDIKTSGLYGNPETWWRHDYDDAERARLLARLRPSGTAGQVAFQLDTSRKFNLSAVFPALFKLLSANGGLELAKQMQVQVAASKVENRLIDWTALYEYRREKLIRDSVLRHFDANDFVITVGDVLLHEYSARLIVNRKLSAEAKAQLDAAWKAFEKGSGGRLSFSSDEGGTYQVKATEPVIIAVFVGVPPRGSLRSMQKIDVQPAPLALKLLEDLSQVKLADLPIL